MKLMHKFSLITALLLLMAHLTGCGETIAGIGKDIKRVGHGVKTIFFRDGK